MKNTSPHSTSLAIPTLKNEFAMFENIGQQEPVSNTHWGLDCVLVGRLVCSEFEFEFKLGFKFEFEFESLLRPV